MVRKAFGWKHGDVGTMTYLHHEGKLHEVELMPLDWARSRDTILFVIYRNPMSWLRSLHCNPHQAPESYWLTFEEFIRKPYRSFHCDPPGSDSHPDKSIRMKQVKRKNMIDSYDSVFAMRKIKLKIFESFKYRFHNVVYINLETLEQDPERYLREISDTFKLQMNHRFVDVTTYKGGDAPYKKSTYDPIEYKNLQHILSDMAWDEEAKVGYALRVGAKLLAHQARLQADPESLLNVFPFRQYFKNGNLLRPFEEVVPAAEAYRREAMQSVSG